MSLLYDTYFVLFSYEYLSWFPHVSAYFFLNYLLKQIYRMVHFIVMHARTKTIAETFNISSKDIGNLYGPDKNLNATTLKNLENLGIPNTAIEQIKFFEMIANNLEPTHTKDEWIAWLLRKTKKSLTAFLKKNFPLKIVFRNADWHMYAEAYTKSVLQLHKTCKPYFDEFAARNITLLIDLTGDEIIIKE